MSICNSGCQFFGLKVAVVGLYWLSHERRAVIGPAVASRIFRPAQKDDRQSILSIVPVLTSSCRRRDTQSAYDPRTTARSQFDRWSWRGLESRTRGSGQASLGWRRSSHSTVVTSGSISWPMALEGGVSAGSQLVARQPDHRDPHAHRGARLPRYSLAAPRLRSDVRTVRVATNEAPGWIQRLAFDRTTTPAGCALISTRAA